MSNKVQNYINHIALVLDASGSMRNVAQDLVKVADNQIQHLAQRSKELDQETRVTVYTFEGFSVDCLVYDKDVLRLPSIKGLYKVGGQTPLIDATLKALDDLSKTPELYGEHAFLTYVLTDGAENSSRNRPDTLSVRLAALPDNWTVAAFVPNANGVHEAKKFGFHKDNIAVWDTTSAGVVEAGEVIRRTTDNFMKARTTGVRGYKNLFQMDVAGLSPTAVQRLDKLGAGQFRMYKVGTDIPISTFVEQETRRAYRLGEAFYQLTKPVEVQPQKQIALYERKKHAVYTGKDARQLLGLPNDHTVRVEPAAHPNYEIFIQSTSTNRKLLAGTSLLLLS